MKEMDVDCGVAQHDVLEMQQSVYSHKVQSVVGRREINLLLQRKL